ncbi:hypothetical protein GWI33_021636 [Rhynchophorus ferrugineus]|uniref:Carboxylic ester hydrolase n=1 Tax=Rhynchophorus ferrugineus TaxID=354439 RepID=A0A834IVN2_RHYFE|nr:hypothetical protein GWI33_021636 [Rhynchophorus ferrugineus]
MVLKIFLAAFLLDYCIAGLIVDLPIGKVQGTTFASTNGQTFYAWRGIPYGQPPVGELRFMPPVKATPCDCILDGSKDRAACYFTWTEWPAIPAGHSEDCLFVNVYSPEDINNNSITNRPVLFWIYGGSLQTGSGDFINTDPTAFLEQGIIVVTFNYRVGAFGFLSTNDDVILGNAGLKDQNLALSWTKENIHYFGGNPDEITIMGESAGAMSVGYQIVSPKSKGLFRGAIMQSGNSLSDFFKVPTQARSSAYAIASRINSSITDSSSSSDVKAVLQSVSADDFMQYSNDLGVLFTTILEVESEDSFLTEPMYEVLESGNFNQVPIIIGHNSEESLFFYSTEDDLQNNADSIDASPSLLIPNMPLKDGVDRQEIGEKIKDIYVGDGNFSSNLAAVLNWYSDDRFVRTTYKQALLQSKYVPVYFYRLSFYGTPSKGHFLIPGAGKVSHGADVPYFFNITVSPLKTDEDFLTRQRMVTLWSNFVKTLNPTPDGSNSDVLQNITWPVTTPSNVQVLDIGDDMEIYAGPKMKDIPFWDSIWETYSYRPYNTF